MQTLALKDKWLAEGAEIAALDMCEYVAKVSGAAAETAALRNSVVLSDFSHLKKFSFDEAEGAEILDKLLAANMLKLRYGKALETFLADGGGNIAASVIAANIDDKIFLLAESADDEACAKIAESKGAEDLSQTHSVLSVDGPDAWKAAKAVFGADIYNLAFMGVEKYEYKGADAIVARAGKTGEFGYQILVPNCAAEALFEELKSAVLSLGGRLAGVQTLLSARAKGNFFNIYGEGKASRNPIELGLQWQIDFGKEEFSGAREIFKFRGEGAKRKLAAVSCAAETAAGAKIFNAEKIVGEVVFADESDKTFALALIDSEWAYPGLAFSAEPNGADFFSTVSRPAIVAQSLLRGME